MFESDHWELSQLAYRYAAAVDSCDVASFLALFTPNARLRTYYPDAAEPFVDIAGHDQLAGVPSIMRRLYSRTAHLMTNHLIGLSGDSATGTVMCLAKHVGKDGAGDEVLDVVVRYVDRYERHRGEWQVSDRQIRLLWTERRQLVSGSFETHL